MGQLNEAIDESWIDFYKTFEFFNGLLKITNKNVHFCIAVNRFEVWFVFHLHDCALSEVSEAFSEEVIRQAD